MKRSFTLIELMLVVIIIIILASVAAPRLVGKAEKARRAAAKADVEANIPSALELYEMDVGEFPKKLEDLIQNPGVDNWDGPYLKRLPKDPWGREYEYYFPGTHSFDYDLASKGKDGVFGTEDDIANWE
ncbi:MAG: type II secretion system major pseudopilin GspG [Candidatus Omnitrophota bacterium]|nr:MAG: type II secretion system major pseudopilin GspG [Candidatus Omnitrophota bacterium]